MTRGVPLRGPSPPLPRVPATAWAVLRPFGVESAVAQRLKVLVGGEPVTTRVRRREDSGPLGRLVAAIGSYGVGADSALAQRLSVARYRPPHAPPPLLPLPPLTPL